MAPDASDWVELVDGDLSVAAADTWVRRPGAGAVVTFSGLVRDVSDGRDEPVTALEYETHEPLALARMRQVVAEIRRRWPDVAAVAMLHRLGRAEVSDPVVVVSVSSPHRAEAFAAAQFGIDALKVSVPLYKRDIWSTGAAWSATTQDAVDVPHG